MPAAIPRGALSGLFISRVLILVFALGFGLAARGEAQTETFSPAIQAEAAQLGSKNRKKRRRAALGLAKRLEPKLLPLLLALREGSLYQWQPESGGERVWRAAARGSQAPARWSAGWRIRPKS